MMTPFSFVKSLFLPVLLAFSLLFAASLPVAADEASATPTGMQPETATITATETPSPQPTPSATETPEQFPTETSHPTEEVEYTRILVKLSPQQNQQKSLRQLDSYGELLTENVLSEALDVYILRVPAGQAEEIIETLNTSENFLYAEPNYEIHAQETIPNDPGWGLQYNMNAIRAPQGWDYSTGSSAITIAILDSGVDMTHPDLFGKIVAGYDFVNNDNNPSDDNGHGSHVAGLAAAYGNNGTGMAGVSWGARIMPVKVLNAGNSGTYANVAAGIIWATDQGARVINLSLGGIFPSMVLGDAVNYAAERGVLLVAAAGNFGSPSVLYPAAYPAVMAVSATDSANQLASFSNYGPQIELAAPGAGIYSLNTSGGYITRNGTSMSAPQVSGLAAILLGLPGNGSAFAVRNQMKASALDLGSPGQDNQFGAGLIQMDAAIWLALASAPTPTPAASQTSLAAEITSSPEPGYYILPASVTPSVLPALTVFATQQVDLRLTSAITAPTVTDTPQILSVATPMAETNGLPTERDNSLLCWGSTLLLLGLLLLGLARKLKTAKT